MTRNSWNRPTERAQIDRQTTTSVRGDRRGPAVDRTDETRVPAEPLDDPSERPGGPNDRLSESADDVVLRASDEADRVARDEHTR
ncbi:hypothetical protein SAMN05216559_2382 [Halomicrobium zhouii]|uniref:Uncharacterized protein n=1 Tax=Halomicrobium zhouii TaxID=767519 RepID=A0A1I6LAT9_9EURY|nr:hypothetical protein [Halomicrobium zhouii]SFS00605.1 hypothetical protein SAMN05216559_2382 [Halomicrobium zhouii]